MSTSLTRRDGFSNNFTICSGVYYAPWGSECQRFTDTVYSPSIKLYPKCHKNAAFSYIVYDFDKNLNITSNVTYGNGVSAGFGDFVVHNGSEYVYAKGIFGPMFNDSSIKEFSVPLPKPGNYCLDVQSLKNTTNNKDYEVKFIMYGMYDQDYENAAFRISPLLLPAFFSVILTLLFTI
ncbi:hypothetical protein SJAG_02677 [Schizosaccharomyces japonicus yFS275]|uniref:Uncharacterized protein n=1 Tax=Schizosaccharomyces japonicus (strain yFS275 / FY16936) TaxID=402676 RepID=B6K0W0_SCHJY|nr:hypothetical protein SJAG_02677 [Schizosaccharomyces japonicus yFS275]EEB07581.1 hypothetical protein SJAG_02677 [Schizosaccharomyces japonicus yFS275]